MIWDLIRDFYVQYIFGGCDSHGYDYNPIIGYLWSPNFDDLSTTHTIAFPVGYSTADYENIAFLSMGDWLSTTATIITMVAFVIGIIAFMVWLFKLVGNLIMLRN